MEAHKVGERVSRRRGQGARHRSNGLCFVVTLVQQTPRISQVFSHGVFVDADDREQRRVVSEMSVRGVTQCLLAPNMPFGVDGNRWSNHSN